MKNRRGRLWLNVGDSGTRSALPIIGPFGEETAPGAISNVPFSLLVAQKPFMAINATATIVANNSTLIGGAITRLNNSSDVTLTNHSLWEMTESSNLTNLINNHSTIDFTPFNAGYKTLTVNEYRGDDGLINLNTYLKNDLSPSDLLMIDGGVASGSTTLQIMNTTGQGDKTVANGILVVDAVNGATTGTNAFSLGNRVVAGPYEYKLFRSSADDSGLENWYLRSTLDCNSGVISEECPLSPDSLTPNYRNEVSLYSTLTSMASLYGLTLLDTLDERVGIQKNLVSKTANAIKPSAVWGRIIGAHGVHKGGYHGIYSKEGAGFDYDMGGLQTGIDLYRDEFKEHVGVYGAVGQINGDAEHFNHVKAGQNKINAYTGGGYWTHYGTSGWYVDSIMQGTWYDAKEKSTGAMQLDATGAGFAASLESGSSPFQFAHHWMLVPQAQLVYQNISFGKEHEAAAEVRFHGTNYVTGRLGARLSKDFAVSGSKKPYISDLTAWVRPSFWREFQGNAVTSFSSETGFIPFTSNLGGNWVEITGGLTFKVKEHIKFYASTGYNAGLNNLKNNYAYNGSIGANAVWG